MPTKRSSISYPKRGQILISNLSPGFGHEMHKKRPILVISNNILNKTLPTVVVIPFSSIVPRFIGPDVVVFESQKGLEKKSALIVNQIRAIDKTRLGKKIGTISKAKIAEVERALSVALKL